MYILSTWLSPRLQFAHLGALISYNSEAKQGDPESITIAIWQQMFSNAGPGNPRLPSACNLESWGPERVSICGMNNWTIAKKAEGLMLVVLHAPGMRPLYPFHIPFQMFRCSSLSKGVAPKTPVSLYRIAQCKICLGASKCIKFF